MKTIVISIALIASCSSVMAEDWINVATNESTEFQARSGSFVVTTNKGNVQIAVVTGKTLDKKENRIDLEKWYVSTADCSRKQGKVATLSLDGTFKYDSDFIFGAGNMGSEKAEFICGVLQYQINEKNKKGI
jgi:hypothetical protein